MQVSDAGRKAIEEHEGYRLEPYKDSHGFWSVGAGHKLNREPHEGEVWTKAEVDDQLKNDLKWAEEHVTRAVTRAVSQEQFDAMVSLAFNIGVNAFYASSVCRFTNEGLFYQAGESFLLWSDHGLLSRRREEERELYLSGVRNSSSKLGAS